MATLTFKNLTLEQANLLAIKAEEGELIDYLNELLNQSNIRGLNDSPNVYFNVTGYEHNPDNEIEF